MDTNTVEHYGDADALARALNTDATDPRIGDLLAAATAKFIGEVGRSIAYTEADEIWLSGDGGPMLPLPAAPIHGDPIISIAGRPITGGIEIGRRSGILWRAAGWPSGIENIHVTYNHGYKQIPGDIRAAINEAAQLAATSRPGIDQVSSGDESIRFNSIAALGGTTAFWANTVAKYRLSDDGDGR